MSAWYVGWKWFAVDALADYTTIRGRKRDAVTAATDAKFRTKILSNYDQYMYSIKYD